jgi:hypothetical protein
MAMNPALEETLFEKLAAEYRRRIAGAPVRCYLDKSHTNIWLAEKLSAAFPGSLFVGIERNPYATVASMLAKRGIMEWHRRWREFPVPNRFLGITKEMAGTYDSIPLAAQCAIRWVAHHDRMNALKGVLGDALLVISYEVFAHDTAAVIHGLRRFLGLSVPIPVPEVNVASLAKWRAQLTDGEIGQIQGVVGFSPEAMGGGA